MVERGKAMRAARLRLPFMRFVMLMPYMTTDTITRLTEIPCPKRLLKVEIPADLQLATFGLLTKLQQSTKEDDYVGTSLALVEALTDIPTKVLATLPAGDVLGVVNMVQKEMERIGKLFQSLNGDKTSEELAAGIDRLNFGAFGIVDWYAKRMGIIDHEEVFATPWARIFQCMKIDHENNEFEKRYRKVLEQRSKHK